MLRWAAVPRQHRPPAPASQGSYLQTGHSIIRDLLHLLDRWGLHAGAQFHQDPATVGHGIPLGNSREHEQQEA